VSLNDVVKSDIGAISESVVFSVPVLPELSDVFGAEEQEASEAASVRVRAKDVILEMFIEIPPLVI
jgi:hypothetical protein